MDKYIDKYVCAYTAQLFLNIFSNENHCFQIRSNKLRLELKNLETYQTEFNDDHRYTGFIYIQGLPAKKSMILIVNNCFRFQDRNFYFIPVEKGGLHFFI